MNINWTTVFFQIINFLIIVWILKRYLFKPVLSSMDNREKVIQQRLLDAENARQNAEEERKKLTQRMEALEHAKNEIMAKAYKKADKEYSTLIKTFNAEMTGKRQAFEEHITMEREFLRNSIRELAGETIVKTVSDALVNLANVDIQTAVFEMFLKKIQNGELPKSLELAKYYSKKNPISVRTSFDIKEKERKAILSAVSGLIGKKVDNVNFSVDRQIICGIEVVCTPLLISYGMNTYIDELKVNLDNGLAELTKTAKFGEDKK